MRMFSAPASGSPIEGSTRTRRWTLSADAFERLLAALNSDRERAAIEYEQLRHRVIGLLRWWGALQPEELADETLDRVARKLEEGASVVECSLGAYVRGVARMVFYESTRQPSVTPLDREPLVSPDHLDPSRRSAGAEAELASACLDRCLASLDAADRGLLLRYYDAGKAADVRKRLADELGISVTALRIRTHRLRAQVERGMTACLGLAGRR